MSYHVTPTATPIARKAHTCDWCAETMAKGEPYKTWSGVTDGYWWRVKVHPECAAATVREMLEGCDPEEVTCGERHNRGMTFTETEDAALAAAMGVQG